MSRNGWLSIAGGLTGTAIVIYGTIKSGIYWILIGLVFVVWGVRCNIGVEMKMKQKGQQQLGGRGA